MGHPRNDKGSIKEPKTQRQIACHRLFWAGCTGLTCVQSQKPDALQSRNALNIYHVMCYSKEAYYILKMAVYANGYKCLLNPPKFNPHNKQL
jgi:hypothetical protein